jgi:carbon storage regulator CsrA
MEVAAMSLKRSKDNTKQGWLTLARKINEPLFLTMPDGTQVEMRIVEVRGNTVRTSWLAPKSVKIFRHDAKQSKEGQLA